MFVFVGFCDSGFALIVRCVVCVKLLFNAVCCFWVFLFLFMVDAVFVLWLVLGMGLVFYLIVLFISVIGGVLLFGGREFVLIYCLN